MPTNYFSSKSLRELDTCDLSLRDLFNEVLKIVDCTIIEGHRGEQKQNEYFKKDKSKVEFPNGKHNQIPSLAVDVAPFLNKSVSWNVKHCLYFAGIVIGTSIAMGIEVRWGGDWDRDHEPITDQNFQDLVHYERVL